MNNFFKFTVKFLVSLICLYLAGVLGKKGFYIPNEVGSTLCFLMAIVMIVFSYSVWDI